MNEDLFRGYGVKIKLKNDQNFLKIKETLTRIGIASKKDKKLYQSCHILHKRGEYAIVHFKELFALDGKDTDFSADDKARRNTITKLLEEWGLLDVVNASETEPRAPLAHIKVLAFKDKLDWQLQPKYPIGTKKY